MPLYEFQCRACGSRFEKLLAFSELDQASCPQCHSQDVQRLLSVFGTKSGGESRGSSGSGCSGCSSHNCGSCH